MIKWLEDRVIEMTISTDLATITLHVNRMNVSIKRQSGRLALKKIAYKTLPKKRLTLGQRAHINWKWVDGKRYFIQTEMTRKQGVTILLSDKTDFKIKSIKKKDTK